MKTRFCYTQCVIRSVRMNCIYEVSVVFELNVMAIIPYNKRALDLITSTTENLRFNIRMYGIVVILVKNKEKYMVRVV